MNVTNSTSVFFQTLMYVMNQTIVQEENSYNYYYLNLGIDTNATKCYGSYGCFDLSPPWTSESRPVSLFPEEVSKIEPRYPMYTRRNPVKPVYFDLNDFDLIGSSGIDLSLPIYLIAHGYMDAGEKPWIFDMTRELLQYEDCSVIIVDWHGGSGPPYTQAVANIRLVGSMTAHLIGDLSKHMGHKQLKSVHCIGHSLGAHLCGYVGYALQKDFGLYLGRITGLDPAEPHFSKVKAPVRLDRSAALYVDIIHTDASAFIRGGLGILEKIGHVDYFPNGGTDQPGCGKSFVQYISAEKGSFFKGMRQYVGCNHMKAHEFFTDSINPRCSFTSISCSSFEDFRNGKCFECDKNNNHCVKFGMHSRKSYERLVRQRIVHPNKNLVQYLLTGEQKPYCKGHYRVTVTISNSEESKTHGGEIGQLWFIMHSSSDGRGLKSNKTPLNDGGYHEPGAVYKAVIPADEVPHLRAVEVEWQYDGSVFNPLTWRLLATPRVFVAKVTVDSLEIKKSITVCPKGGKALISKMPQMMLPSYC